MDNTTATSYYDPTTEYDYGDTSPCQKQEVRAFGAQLLPPLYSLVFIIGLVGNILVVLVLMQNKRLKSMTSIYLLNLAVSDLLFLFTLPFWIDYNLKDNWAFGNATCKFLSGLYYMGLYSEIFFIILLTVDRYLAIVHAVFALRARTVPFGIISSAFTWLLAVLASIPGLYFSKTQWEFSHYTCSLHYPYESLRQWKQFQALKLNLLGLVMPLLVMTVCYAGIIKVLLKRPNEKKAKAVRLIFVIMVIFFLFWTPYNLAVLVSAFQDSFFTDECEQSKQLDLAIQVTEVIAYTHCCVNPIVYVFVGERFRKYLRQLFHRHVPLPLAKWVPFLSAERLERTSSLSPSTGEHELSAGF
ncbi:C-C chemokine receptor type 1 [Erinaceus europaeus]|uniref:C-C chemokine receptor type 1 n=1 Tax=Erinaceus europaeus TaxID=9365 RepID=A0A1S3A9M1_ERIEU|nr:C-C chemokine receptor type 1 [Erinaceus europaeus]XP_060060857.1 C-C chemokine receptor type 1 [Erinaceus europaeus]XP_060060858.1 C-C chemokine receptor type 1 [Erinaceus europaeus]XP_060060859.1 C-C chemokine receptor type 1 [Erinaceus europaeus]